MGVQERKAREKEELRQEILGAARDLFADLGYEAVSMRKIAERIEYSPTTIYLYFRDKADLLDCLCADTFARMMEILQAISADQPDPLQAVKDGLRAYIHFGRLHPSEYRVAFMMPPVHQRDPERPTRREKAGQRAFDWLRNAVAACVAAGALRVADVELTAHMLWSAIHGLTSLLITHTQYEWPDQEALISHLLETLTKGLETA